MKLSALSLLSIAALGACANLSADDAYENDLVASGREIAMRQCSSCHAIYRGSPGPMPAAPALEGLLQRYNSSMLTDHLIEGIRVGHDEMPVFDFDVRTTDALIAYLKWLDS
jgi:mono/diheme cytochrome c family protein